MKSDSTKTPRTKRFSLFRVLGRKLPLEAETTRFVLASALDVFMTYLALRYSEEGRTSRVIGEGNAFAAFFIHRWGIRGMVYFKFSSVTFVVLLAQVIAQHRMTTAKRLLDFGAIVVSCVVIYSLVLLLKSM
jgi:hypothetical protein